MIDRVGVRKREGVSVKECVGRSEKVEVRESKCEEVEVTLKSFLADRSLLYNKTFVCFYDFSGQI